MSKLKGFCTPEQAAELDEIERRESSEQPHEPSSSFSEPSVKYRGPPAPSEKPREGATPSQQEVSANLVHRLRWAASYGSFVDVRKMSREAADFLESLPSASAAKWMHVSQGMPEKPVRRTHYWVVCADGYPPENVCLARWTGECFKGAEDDDRLSKVTHWMLLPALPEGER